MTFQSFLEKWNGQANVGNTTENKGQCVGLVAKWVDALGLPHIWGDAQNLFVNADEKFFKKILNTPDAIPQTGDIIIWSNKFNGTVGHTGIATGTASIDTFECFEQNDPVGSPSHLKTYNYNFVIGWLRSVQVQNDQVLIDQLRADRDKNWELYQQEQRAKILLEDAVAAKQKSIDTLTKENLDLKKRLEDTTMEKNNLSGSLQGLTRSLDDTKTALSVCEDRLANRKDLAKYTARELIKEIVSRIRRRR